MPLTKNQFERLRKIDALINSRVLPYPTKEKLRAACEEMLYGSDRGDRVSPSTIEKDLRKLRDEFDAPLTFNNTYKGYAYSQAFSLDSIPFSDAEKQALMLALSTLNKYSGIGIFKHFADAIERLREKVVLNQSEEALSNILFEELPEQSGIQHMELFSTAIQNKISLEVLYWSFSSNKEKRYLVHPYCLKQYHRHWYAICREPAKNRMVTFEFGRVKEIVLLEDTFNTIDFNIDHYFKYSPGISVSTGKPYLVRIEVNKTERIDFFKRFKLHPLQYWENTNIIAFESFLGSELIHNIRGHGKALHVLEPQALINKLKD